MASHNYQELSPDVTQSPVFYSHNSSDDEFPAIQPDVESDYEFLDFNNCDEVNKKSSQHNQPGSNDNTLVAMNKNHRQNDGSVFLSDDTTCRNLSENQADDDLDEILGFSEVVDSVEKANCGIPVVARCSPVNVIDTDSCTWFSSSHPQNSFESNQRSDMQEMRYHQILNGASLLSDRGLSNRPTSLNGLTHNIMDLSHASHIHRLNKSSDFILSPNGYSCKHGWPQPSTNAGGQCSEPDVCPVRPLTHPLPSHLLSKTTVPAINSSLPVGFTHCCCGPGLPTAAPTPGSVSCTHHPCAVSSSSSSSASAFRGLFQSVLHGLSQAPSRGPMQHHQHTQSFVAKEINSTASTHVTSQSGPPNHPATSKASQIQHHHVARERRRSFSTPEGRPGGPTVLPLTSVGVCSNTTTTISSGTYCSGVLLRPLGRLKTASGCGELTGTSNHTTTSVSLHSPTHSRTNHSSGSADTSIHIEAVPKNQISTDFVEEDLPGCNDTEWPPALMQFVDVNASNKFDGLDITKLAKPHCHRWHSSSCGHRGVCEAQTRSLTRLFEVNEEGSALGRGYHGLIQRKDDSIDQRKTSSSASVAAMSLDKRHTNLLRTGANLDMRRHTSLNFKSCIVCDMNSAGGTCSCICNACGGAMNPLHPFANQTSGLGPSARSAASLQLLLIGSNGTSNNLTPNYCTNNNCSPAFGTPGFLPATEEWHAYNRRQEQLRSVDLLAASYVAASGIRQSHQSGGHPPMHLCYKHSCNNACTGLCNSESPVATTTTTTSEVSQLSMADFPSLASDSSPSCTPSSPSHSPPPPHALLPHHHPHSHHAYAALPLHTSHAHASTTPQQQQQQRSLSNCSLHRLLPEGTAWRSDTRLGAPPKRRHFISGGAVLLDARRSATHVDSGGKWSCSRSQLNSASSIHREPRYDSLSRSEENVARLRQHRKAAPIVSAHFDHDPQTKHKQDHNVTKLFKWFHGKPKRGLKQSQTTPSSSTVSDTSEPQSTSKTVTKASQWPPQK